MFVLLPPLPQAAPPVSLPPSVVCDVENRLRHATQRIRVSEFFKDFDPLRTGFITSEHFVVIYCSYPGPILALQATPFMERKGLVALQPSSCHQSNLM